MRKSNEVDFVTMESLSRSNGSVEERWKKGSQQSELTEKSVYSERIDGRKGGWGALMEAVRTNASAMKTPKWRKLATGGKVTRRAHLEQLHLFRNSRDERRLERWRRGQRMRGEGANHRPACNGVD